jgi:hypothetical protein
MLKKISSFGLKDALVTVLAPGTIGDLVAVVVFDSIPMHLVAGVTLRAFEVLLSMDVRRDSFVLSEVFPVHSTPVARGADGPHGRGFHKSVGVQQSSLDLLGTADVAFPAAAVARHAVAFHGHIHLVADRPVTAQAHIDGFLVGREGRMEAAGIPLGDIGVTHTAGFDGIRKGGVLYQPLVSCLPIRIGWISTVTVLTGNAAVNRVLFEIVAVYKNFLVGSQLLHITAASPLARGFCRNGWLYGGFGYLSGDGDELSRVRVAFDTLTIVCPDLDAGSEKEKHHDAKNHQPRYKSHVSPVYPFISVVLDGSL